MKSIDFNCFVGGWPFHKVRNNQFQDIQRIHRENGIDYGYISSTNGIFYNDPYEAAVDLYHEIKASDYKQVMVVNPDLPGCEDDIHRAVKDLQIAGIRILPGFHGYSLQDDCVKKLCALLKQYQLPLFLTLRMEDERVTYLFHPKSVPMEEVRDFISTNKDLKILLCNIRMDEVFNIKDHILDHSNLMFDTSGLKDGLFPLERLKAQGLLNHLVYGSLAPIYCLKSTMLLVTEDDITKQEQEDICSGRSFL